MLRREEPPTVDLVALNQRIEAQTSDEKLRDNLRFHALHNSAVGVFGWRPGNPHGISRRRWIERFVYVKNKAGHIVPMILNDSQRRLEARILRMERAGVPVRVIILKARQQGFSTYAAAFQLWYGLTRDEARSLIIAHRSQASKTIFARIKLMVRKMRKDPDDENNCWNFKMPRLSMGELGFGSPIHSEMVVDSAEVDEPGRSDTVQVLHISEAPMWKDSMRKANAVLQIIPEEPGTYAFNEGTAKGDIGWFYSEFWTAWRRQDNLEAHEVSRSGWWSMFFPWYFHQEYRWTRLFKSELDPEVVADIRATLTEDESVLLEQKYLQRGLGWIKVDFDQLAWRRYFIVNKCQNDLNAFHQEYPATPEEAFLASGRPLFDPMLLRHQRDTNQAQPIWIGEILDPDGEEAANIVNVGRG